MLLDRRHQSIIIGDRTYFTKTSVMRIMYNNNTTTRRVPGSYFLITVHAFPLVSRAAPIRHTRFSNLFCPNPAVAVRLLSTIVTSDHKSSTAVPARDCSSGTKRIRVSDESLKNLDKDTRRFFTWQLLFLLECVSRK